MSGLAILIPLLLSLTFSPSSLLSIFSPASSGGNQAPAARPPRVNAAAPDDEPPNLPEEMRTRMELERREKDYQKLVDSATQLNALSAEVAKLYKENTALSAEQVKKLASIEKLARRILAESGGEEVSEKSSAEPPMGTSEAIDKLVATAADVKKSLERQSRYVVSAAVIANSNDLIHLAQYIRRGQK